MTTLSELKMRTETYLSKHAPGEKLNAMLGHGTDGAVWQTTRDTAIKVLERSQGYLNERDSYLRLAEFGVTDRIAGFYVPAIHKWDDQLMVVEIDIVQARPYVIDFAKTRIDRSPDFPEQTVLENEEQGRDLFGDNWPKVLSLLDALESFQLYYLDPKPHNIVF